MKKVTFTEYWENLHECDLCGHSTHGRVYDDQPEVVWCSSCNRPLIGNPTPDELDFDHGEYIPPASVRSSVAEGFVPFSSTKLNAHIKE